MSDSLIAFQPAIEEPSNMMPSVKVSSLIVSTACARCCHLPRGSVKRRSTYLTSFSLIICRTFFGSDMDLSRGWCVVADWFYERGPRRTPAFPRHAVRWHRPGLADSPLCCLD